MQKIHAPHAIWVGPVNDLHRAEIMGVVAYTDALCPVYFVSSQDDANQDIRFFCALPRTWSTNAHVGIKVANLVQQGFFNEQAP